MSQISTSSQEVILATKKIAELRRQGWQEGFVKREVLKLLKSQGYSEFHAELTYNYSKDLV